MTNCCGSGRSRPSSVLSRAMSAWVASTPAIRAAGSPAARVNRKMVVVSSSSESSAYPILRKRTRCNEVMPRSGELAQFVELHLRAALEGEHRHLDARSTRRRMRELEERRIEDVLVDCLLHFDQQLLALFDVELNDLGLEQLIDLRDR